MKKLILTTFISIIVYALCFSQDNKSGWNGIPWGITKQELVSYYKDSVVQQDTEEESGMIIMSYPYIGENFKTIFTFDTITNKLSEIGLSLISDKNNYNQKEYLNKNSKLLNGLIKKYGKSNCLWQDDNSANHEWFTNNESITFTYICTESFQMSFITFILLNDDYTFRKSKWGDTVSQVKESGEGDPYIDKDNMLAYKKQVANMSCLIGYMFIDNKLIRTKYIFEEEHTNKNDFIKDYLKVKSLLTEKYGIAKETNDENWRNQLYLDNLENYGFAISLGHLFYHNNWETTNTKINMSLSGENYELKLVVEYKSKRYSQIENKIMKENMLKDF